MRNMNSRRSSRPLRRSTSLLTLPVLVLSGCLAAPLPPVENDAVMGAEVNQQVTEQMGIIEDAARTEYVGRIGDRLVGELDDRRFDFSFKIVDQVEPNAFAAPGGFIFVSRGLLGLTNNEDELATVMGHEIIHVTHRHTAQQMSKARSPRLITLPGRLVGAVLSEDLGNLINSPINNLGAVYLASYGRDQESESDEFGLQLAASAGYSPESLAIILGRLEQAVEIHTGQHREKSFFDSHPSTPDRVEKIEAWAAEVVRSDRRPFVPDHDDYLRGLDGLLLEENPANGVFLGRKFLHPELGFTIDFPQGWETVNAPVAAGAIAPDEEGVIFIGVKGEGTDPGLFARDFSGKLRAEHGVGPDRSEAVEVGDWPGYLLTYDDASTRPSMNLHVLWVARDGLMYQLIAMAPERLRPTLRETVLSMKPITDEERESFQVVRLRLAEAKVGESLGELCRRTDNIYSEQETAVFNGLPVGASLEEGQLIKIGVREPYRSRP